MDRHGLVCRAVLEQPDITQRELAGKLDVSLGTANGLIKECLAKGYIGEESSQKGTMLLQQEFRFRIHYREQSVPLPDNVH